MLMPLNVKPVTSPVNLRLRLTVENDRLTRRKDALLGSV